MRGVFFQSENVACGAFSDISFVSGGGAPRAKSVIFAARRDAWLRPSRAPHS
jgi:hypothetical protein